MLTKQPLVKPERLHPDTIIQPNRVTMMRYAATGLEENVMTLTMESLQGELYHGKMMQRNLWGEPVLNLDLKEIAPNLKPSDAYKRLQDLTSRKFQYTCTSPKNGKEVKKYGVIFPSVDRSDNYIQVKLNTDALPFLLWIGEFEGEKTFFDKKSSISLSGGHTKRLYKFLCSWKSRGGTRIKIEELKFTLDIIGKYPKLLDFKRFVLDKAKEEMRNNIHSDIWFEYSTETSEELKSEGGRGRRSHDQIIFKIHTRYKSNNEQLEGVRKGVSIEHFTEVFGFLQYCIGSTTSKAQDIAGACADEGDKFMNQRYLDTKKLRSDEKPKAFNFFMKSAQKLSNNKVFELRYKDCKKA